MSSTDMAEPRRVKLRIEIAEPSFTKSSTESENTEPSRDMPRRATEDPRRAKALTDIDEPMWT